MGLIHGYRNADSFRKRKCDSYERNRQLSTSQIVWCHVPGLLLQEYLNVIAPEDGEARWIVLGLEPEPLVPFHGWLDIADQKHCCRVAQPCATYWLRPLVYFCHWQERSTTRGTLRGLKTHRNLARNGH